MGQFGRRIAVYNFKGGVGKTGIAVNLALSLNLALVTNDVYTPVDLPLPEERFLKIGRDLAFPELPDDAEVVFDLGGYPDPRVAAVLQTSDWVIVPTENEFRALQVTLHTLAELREHTRRIVVVANKLKRGDAEQIEQVLRTKAPGGKVLTILPLKSTTAFNHVFERGKPLNEIVAAGGQLGHAFAPVSAQFDKLITFLNTSPNA